MQKWIQIIFALLLIIGVILLLSSLFGGWISKLKGSINQTVNSSNTVDVMSDEALTKGTPPDLSLMKDIQAQKNTLGDLM